MTRFLQSHVPDNKKIITSRPGGKRTALRIFFRMKIIKKPLNIFTGLIMELICCYKNIIFDRIAT
jgi:hypothetical protein